VAKAIAFGDEFQDVAVMGETIQEGTQQTVVTKQIRMPQE
jgi:hypothetical protein